MKLLDKLTCLAAWLLVGPLASASVLYDFDFTAPEVGAYNVVFGNPSIQSSAGPFTDALIFHAVTGYDQISLPIPIANARYDIQYDLFVHNLLDSQYAFSVFLDTPSVRTLQLHGGLHTIKVSFPSGGRDLSTFSNDRVYHFEVVADLLVNQWSVFIDGTQKYAAPLNATNFNAIRFSMAPSVAHASDAPGTYAALDNLVVTVVPEPGPGALVSAALLILTAEFRARRRQG